MEPETQKFESLLELAAILSQQTDFQEILRVTAQKAASLLNAETATIMMINPQTRNTVRTVMQEGREDDPRQFNVVQTHVSGWIIKHQRPFASADLKTDPNFAKNLFAGIPIKTVLGVPLRVEGLIIGTLILLNVEQPRETPASEASDQPPATSRSEAEIPPQRDNQSKHSEDPASAGQQALSFLEHLATIAAPYLRNVQKIQKYFAAPVPEATLLAKYEALGLIGKSKKFIELLQAVEAAARCEVRVLLEGASGTGKELTAARLPPTSSRASCLVM